MSYQAVLDGARGLWYCGDARNDATAVTNPGEEWVAVTNVAKEMAAMAPIFAHGAHMDLPYEPYETSATARGWRYHGRDYLVLIARETGRDALVPEALLDGGWRPLFERRRDPRDFLREVGGSYYLRQHAVLVLESRLRWDALRP